MNNKLKRKVSDDIQQRINYISMMLKEMRLSENRNQDGYIEFGVSRRQIQVAEYGNISLKKLFMLLDLYGYKLSDLEC